MRKLIGLIFLAAGLCFCMPDAPEKAMDVPYPSDEDIQYYQVQADSGNQEFWLDLKAVASAFMNNSEFYKTPVSTDKFVIVAEGLFNARIEIEMDEYLLLLFLERPFQHLGRKSIWQVVKFEKQKWPEEELK